MTPDALAADTGFLTTEQAIADLTAADTHEDEAPAQAEAAPSQTDTEAEPAAEDASEPETATEGDDAETEDAEAADEAKLPVIEPPRFWDAEAKKRFGELPTDLQELVLAKETERDKATAKAIEDAALKRKAADGEASRIAQFNGVLDKLLPQAIDTFKSRWEGVDWDAVIDQRGAEEALKLQNQMRSEQGMVQQLQAAKNEAEHVQHQKFVEAEMAKLPEMAPDLVDPKFGKQRMADVGKFLIESGVPTESLNRISALETSIAYDAMRWRQAQAKAKEQASAPKTPAQPRPATPARPSVRPTAAPSRGSPETARLKTLTTRFDQDPSVENLEALLKAQGN